MDQPYFEGKEMSGTNYTHKRLPPGEYENCRFEQCDFTESDLSRCNFVDCIFEKCNLSNIKTANSAFRSAWFHSCKLVGIHFDLCDSFLFSVKFDDCRLNVSSFYTCQLKNTSYTNCILHDVDFVESNLSGAVFTNCDLKGALFDKTILENTDMSSSYNFQIDPETNKINKAKFSLSGLPGLLMKYNLRIE